MWHARGTRNIEQREIADARMSCVQQLAAYSAFVVVSISVS